MPRHPSAMPLVSFPCRSETRREIPKPERGHRPQTLTLRPLTLTRILAVLYLPIAVTFLSSAHVAANAAEDKSAATGAHSDLYGDPIPYGGKVRLGTERFRPVGDDWHSAITFASDGRTLLMLTGDGRIAWWDALTGKRKNARKLDVNTGGFAAAPDRTTFAFAYSKFIESESRMTYGLQIRDTGTGDLVGDIPLEGHQGETKLLYTPDGRSIIHAGGEGRIRIIDVALQEELLNFQLPETGRRRVDCVAISPDGNQIAAACAQKLFIWNWLQGEDPEVLDGYERLYSMVYSPDGQSLVLGQNLFRKKREEVQILNLKTREVTRQFKDPVMERFRIPNMLFANGGKLLIVPNADYVGTTQDNAVLVWDVASGELVHRLQSENTRPGMIAVSPNEQLLATASGRVISVWDLEDGRQLADELVAHTAAITTVRFMKDGTRIVTASDDETARVWDSTTGKQLGQIRSDHWIRGMTVSHDGKWIVTSSLDDTVCLWEAETLKKVYELAGHGRLGGYRSVAFTPDSSKFTSFGDDGYLRVWDVATGRALLEEELEPGRQPLRGEGEGPFHMQSAKGVFSADASKLLVMRRDAAYLFNALASSEIKKIPTEKPIESACFSADGQYLLFARPTVGPKRTPLKNGGVRSSAPDKFEAVLMDLADDSEKWAFEVEERFGAIGLSPNSKLVALCQRSDPYDAIYLLDAATGRELAKIDKVEKISWDSADNRLSFSSDGRRLAVALANTTVVVWDLEEMGVWK